MTTTLALIVLLALGTALVLALGRHAELARLRVQRGRTEFVRGRLPPKLLDDLTDLVADCPASEGEIRLVIDQGRPRVVTHGLSEGCAQQIRNVVGMYRTAQIRAGKPPRRRRA